MAEEPFHPTALFWTLPLEIREEIYYYALFQPPEHCTPDDCIRFESANIVKPKVWWATERMTRLLRVTRQVHDEAEAVLYSRFKFCFPYYTDTELVHTVLDPLSPRARDSLRTIELIVVLRCRIPSEGGYADFGSKRNEAIWKEAFSLLVELLPGLRNVNFGIAFVGMKVPEEEQTHVVDSALRIASPLKNVENFRVSPMGTFEGQRLKIMREVVQRVQAGFW